MRRTEKAFWDLHSRSYDDAAGATRAFERGLAQWIGSPPADGGRALLDLGCGTGRLLPILAAAGWSVVGADVSSGMLRKASSRILASASGPAGLVRLDLNQPLPFGEVDHVVLVHSLQAVREPGAVLRRVHEILAPGGRLLVVTKKEPGRPRPKGRFLIRLLKHVAGAIGWTRGFPGDRLGALLGEVGFHVCEDRSTGAVAAVMAAKERS